MSITTSAFDSKSFLKGLTQRPGIYQMLGENESILYIGKAKNLRKRVASYFSKSKLPPKTQALVNRIISIDVTVTETEIEALLLEQNLIKQNQVKKANKTQILKAIQDTQINIKKLKNKPRINPYDLRKPRAGEPREITPLRLRQH